MHAFLAIAHASYDRRFLSMSNTENIPSANTFGWLVRSQVSRRSAHDNGMVSSGRAPNFTRISVAWSLISVICLVSSGRGCAGKSARPQGSAAGLIARRREVLEQLGAYVLGVRGRDGLFAAVPVGPRHPHNPLRFLNRPGSAQDRPLALHVAVLPGAQSATVGSCTVDADRLWGHRGLSCEHQDVGLEAARAVDLEPEHAAVQCERCLHVTRRARNVLDDVGLAEFAKDG